MHVTLHMIDGEPFAVTKRSRDGRQTVTRLEGTTLRQFLRMMRALGYSRRFSATPLRPFDVLGRDVMRLDGVTSCHFYQG